MTTWARCVVVFALIAQPGTPMAFPLDGYESTGIARLEAYQRASEALVAKRTLVPGALRPTAEVQLQLSQQPEFELPAPDPDASRKLALLLGTDADRYAISLLDLTDPLHPKYVEQRGSFQQSPGSVGKILVAHGWFHALRERFPDRVEDRHEFLRDTRVRADAFIRTDTHDVPIYAVGDDRVRKRPLALGDEGNLYTYLDWMLSASSNAAASTLIEHLLLFRHFENRYPPTAAEAAAYWASPPGRLRDDFNEAMVVPVEQSGLSTQDLRQGSFFTGEGKRIVPSLGSVATARELMRLLVRMERGLLVDEWSSLTLKRLLYQTDRRIRYASHPALDHAKVFFKSGSLYSCVPEVGFVCVKYAGNSKNYMNSVAIVETTQAEPQLHYAVVVLSNVLRKNSALEHQTLALRIHRMVESWHAKSVPTID